MNPTLIETPSLNKLPVQYLRKAINTNSLICKDLIYI
jgi:hypothetical protein